MNDLAGPMLLVPEAGTFMFLWFGFMLVGFGGFVLGLVALIDVARTPIERFGPWWDNTRQAWLIGLAVSFVVPFGAIVAGIIWFATGRSAMRATGVAGRPFWAGAPKPPPPPWPPPPPPYWGPPGPPSS